MQDDFGAELRRARTRKGLDVNTVARRLRIRPDIIQAIEDSDFDRMPPRGYARNMINSYAHLLGLNASEITRSYLDAQYAYQVNAARKNARGTGFDMPAGRKAAAAQDRQMRQSSHYEVSGYQRGDLSQPRNARERLRGEERGGRRMYDDFDSGRIMNRSEAERTYRNAGHRTRNNALGEEPYLNAVASPAPTNTFGGRFAFLQNLNLPLMAVIAVAVLLLIVVLVLAFGPKGSSDDVSSLPVQSASEATESSSSVGVSAPTSFTFSYTVNSGASTWIEVYIDGKQEVAENVDGPATKTFTTSGELEFICADPSGVKATQDGKDVALTPNSEGIVDIKINFNDVLKAWQAEHGVSTAASSSSSSSLRGIDNEARQASSQAAEDAANGADDEDADEDEWDDESWDDESYDDGEESYDDGYYDEDVEFYEE